MSRVGQRSFHVCLIASLLNSLWKGCQAANGNFHPQPRTQLTAQTAECDAEGCTTLTEQQAASGWGPADLHVMNLHVLGNVLHWDFFRNLEENRQETDVKHVFVLRERKNNPAQWANCSAGGV